MLIELLGLIGDSAGEELSEFNGDVRLERHGFTLDSKKPLIKKETCKMVPSSSISRRSQLMALGMKGRFAIHGL